jgi:hypothetical protein
MARLRASAELSTPGFGKAPCSRSSLTEELADPLQVAHVARRADVAVRPVGAEMLEDLGGGDGPVLGDVAPAPEIVVAVRELDRPRPVAARRVDVRATRQQLVDDVELPRHRRPVDRLAGPQVAGVQEPG